VRPDPAQGVFETLLVRAGHPVELDRHLERLARSLEDLYGAAPPLGLRALVLDCAQEVQLGRERVTVAPADGKTFDVQVHAVAVDDADVFPSWERAVSLVPAVLEGGFGEHKWADRSALDPLEAHAGQAAVPLLLDADDQVLEGSRGNVFVVDGGAIVTPPANGRILPGVTRGRVLDVAAELGISSGQESIDLDRLLGADEVFLTGAVRGVEPVRTVQGRRDWEEGSLTRQLSRALQRVWSEPTAASSADRLPSRT
jgi:para-aminobenzoate synthetase / 4-amino-4-deoxychorismate lyase